MNESWILLFVPTVPKCDNTLAARNRSQAYARVHVLNRFVVVDELEYGGRHLIYIIGGERLSKLSVALQANQSARITGGAKRSSVVAESTIAVSTLFACGSGSGGREPSAPYCRSSMPRISTALKRTAG